MVKIDLITINQCKKIVREVTEKEFRRLWKDLEKLRYQIMKLEEEIKAKKIRGAKYW